jgi:hypothetical protein
MVEEDCYTSKLFADANQLKASDDAGGSALLAPKLVRNPLRRTPVNTTSRCQSFARLLPTL